MTAASAGSAGQIVLVVLTRTAFGPQPWRHRRSDARHLFEAGKYGVVTNDQRILDKRIELADVLPPSLNIVTLEQLLKIFDDYESSRRV